MIEPGTRREFVADGHDEASSIGYGRWRTPSGAVVREGERYVKEWRMGFNTVRISGRPGRATWSLLAYTGRWWIVSEAL